MNLLADENIETAMIGWLPKEGHDVAWAAEVLSSSPDADLLAIAQSQSRILITRDRDFGELVYADRFPTVGVVLLRLKARNRWDRPTELKSWWPLIEAKAPGHFLVVTNDRIRVRRLKLEP